MKERWIQLSFQYNVPDIWRIDEFNFHSSIMSLTYSRWIQLSFQYKDPDMWYIRWWIELSFQYNVPDQHTQIVEMLSHLKTVVMWNVENLIKSINIVTPFAHYTLSTILWLQNIDLWTDHQLEDGNLFSQTLLSQEMSHQVSSSGLTLVTGDSSILAGGDSANSGQSKQHELHGDSVWLRVRDPAFS